MQVTIIGAGPAGLAAALHLKRKNGVSPTIYEVRAEPTSLGGAIIVPCNGLRLLDRLGLYEEIVRRAPQTPTAALYSSRGQKLGEIELGAWSTKQTGYVTMRVKRTDLLDVMLAAVRKEGIPVHFDKRLTGIEESDDGVVTTFSDGTTDAADLLLGCDGIHSSVRTLYVDPELSPEYSGIATVYSFASVSALPPSPPPPTAIPLSSTLTEGGMFAVVPCTVSHDTLFWFFQWEVPIPAAGEASRDGWEESSRREEEGFKATLLGFLRDVGTPWGAFMRNVVRATEVVKFFPIFRLPLGGTWSRGRCLLLGDAAHAMQPHIGQGISGALEDVFLLSRLLEVVQPSEPLSTAFERFDHIRRPRVEKFYKMAAGRGEWRKRTGPWAQWLKETLWWLGLQFIAWTGLLRHGFGEAVVVYDIDEVPI